MVASLSFQSAVFPLAIDGLTVPGYAALYAFAINFVISIALTPLLNLIRTNRGGDRTEPSDYHFDVPKSGAEAEAEVAVGVAVE